MWGEQIEERSKGNCRAVSENMYNTVYASTGVACMWSSVLIGCRKFGHAWDKAVCGKYYCEAVCKLQFCRTWWMLAAFMCYPDITRLHWKSAVASFCVGESCILCVVPLMVLSCCAVWICIEYIVKTVCWVHGAAEAVTFMLWTVGNCTG